MWLHRHGWKYFYSDIKELNTALNSNKDNTRDMIVTENIYNIVRELLGHLNKIESEIKKEDNFLKKLEKDIYEIHLVNKIKNKEKIDSYENNLTDVFKKIEISYLKLSKECSAVIILFENTNSPSFTPDLSGKLQAIMNSLAEIERASKDMGSYLSRVLPQIEDFKELVKKEEEIANWVENNVKSWITANTD